MSRLRNWFKDVWPKRLASRWIRLASVIAFVTILIIGINTIAGSEEHTRAAPGLEESSLDESNLPYDFQFIGQGRITAGAEQVWVIGGIPIHLDDRTQLMSTLHVGDFVSLSGRILGSDVWRADRIELSEGKISYYTFNSPLEWVRGSIWSIGGHLLIVDLATELGSNLASSDVLLATFTVLESGTWQALEIKAFDPTVFEPTPVPSPTRIPSESMQKDDSSASTKPAADRNEGWDDGLENKDGDDEDAHGDDKRDEKDRDKDDHKDDDKEDDKDDDKEEEEDEDDDDRDDDD